VTIPLYSRSSDIRNLALNNGCEASSLLSWLFQDELPNTVWFILGTACHEAIEECILEDLDLDEMLAAGVMNLKMGFVESTEVIESASKRSKRSIETAEGDLIRMLTKWYHSVHPDGNNRNKIFDKYQWPPKVEHEIALHDTDATALYTTVDAIFTGNDTAPFGEEVMIVDWKTGSTSKAAPSQLQVYAYGGRKEGWFPKDQTGFVGMFWHLDHDKAQFVDGYIGDEVVTQWIARTYDAKQDIITAKIPVYAPDWYCPYCQAKDICPVNSPSTGKTHSEIGIAIRNATLLTEPERKER